MALKEPEGWRFQGALLGCAPRALQQNNAADLAFRNAQNSLQDELVLLGKTQCAFCDGWGHTHKKCITARKLKGIATKTLEVQVMVLAKRRAILANGNIVNGKLPHYSMLSAFSKKGRPPTDSLISQLMELHGKPKKRFKAALEGMEVDADSK